MLEWADFDHHLFPVIKPYVVILSWPEEMRKSLHKRGEQPIMSVLLMTGSMLFVITMSIVVFWIWHR